MRQMIKTILSVLFLITINTAHGQNILEYSGQGINDTTHYTYQNIIDKWGVPNSYKSHDSEFGLDERYYYGNNLITFREDGLLGGFDIYSSSFSVIWKSVILKVGDPKTKIYQLPDVIIENPETGYYKIWLYDNILGVTIDGNTIKAISFTVTL